jgi:hypothetical protein
MFYPLTVYSSMKGIAVVGVFICFKIDIDFPSCFGVNDSVEHAIVQCRYCVSMSPLHNGQDICHIGRDILTLAHFSTFSTHPAHFTPKIGGEMVEFLDEVYCARCSDEWSMFCSKPEVHLSNGLATVHDWDTNGHTHAHTG